MEIIYEYVDLMKMYCSLLTDIIFAINIMFIHEFKQLDFNLRLIEEWLLVLNDLDSNLFLINEVIRFDHLHNENTVSLTG